MDDWLVEQFEQNRTQLHAIAYRMLGSLSEAEDAVQETWLRYGRISQSGDQLDNPAAWLTTVVGRVCLDELRSRNSRREEPLDAHVPDPVVTLPGPEQQAVQADLVGLALLVVLDTLDPAERLAFVLHDMFAVPFDQIATILGRTSAAARQLASRARRRVQDAPRPDVDLARQRQAVDAFLSAAREGDFDALVDVLDPDIVLRADGGTAAVSRLIRGAREVARQALAFAHLGGLVRPVVVNGDPGLVASADGRPYSLLAFTVRTGRIAEINIIADPARLQLLKLPAA
jgi:RNA polymerase sigma factor (sigma-70 family)